MKQSGFSLFELMIVVAIIGFLSMIAVPSFTKFLAKAKRAEAYMNLGSLCIAMKAYRAEHGKFTANLNGSGGAGWKPEGYKSGGEQENFHYTYGFAQGGEGVSHFTGKLKTPSSHLGASRVGQDSFVAVAAADLLGNGTPDILTIDENNVIKIVQDGLAG